MKLARKLGLDPVQVRLTGAGGQGVITAGVILAEAALRDGMNVVQTQSYGPEARLGASKAEVIISSGAIAYPEVTSPDVLVCLSKDAARKYLAHAHERTVVILDASAEEIPAKAEIHRLPLVVTAAESGSKAATNVVALWALNSIVGIVSPESLREAILARVPAKYRSGNERAIEAAEVMLALAADSGRVASRLPGAQNGSAAAAAANRKGASR
jgi:2-oxoglutarate ferredoxin oxidoreductase subunit gamma